MVLVIRQPRGGTPTVKAHLPCPQRGWSLPQLPVIKNASQGCLPGSGVVISHLKDSHDREEKEKKKLIGLLPFPWVDFLRGESF